MLIILLAFSFSIIFFCQNILKQKTMHNHSSVTRQQICRSPTNNSKAKMLYSFSKSSRFPKQKQNLQKKFNASCDQFYNVQGSNDKRTTSFGYGGKYDFTKDFPQTPGPGIYEYKNQLDEGKRKNKGFCFGSGRSEMQATGLIQKNSNPGPGSYSIPNTKNKISYTLKGKLKVDFATQKHNPGPGAYEINSTFRESGSNFLSKYNNKSGLSFKHGKKMSNIEDKVPGPGSYNYSSLEISPDGNYFLSRMQSAKCHKFGRDTRLTFKNRSKTPGPGSYRVPSEFGYYEYKDR